MKINPWLDNIEGENAVRCGALAARFGELNAYQITGEILFKNSLEPQHCSNLHVIENIDPAVNLPTIIYTTLLPTREPWCKRKQ